MRKAMILVTWCRLRSVAVCALRLVCFTSGCAWSGGSDWILKESSANDWAQRKGVSALSALLFYYTNWLISRTLGLSMDGAGVLCWNTKRSACQSACLRPCSLLDAWFVKWIEDAGPTTSLELSRLGFQCIDHSSGRKSLLHTLFVAMLSSSDCWALIAFLC